MAQAAGRLMLGPPSSAAHLVPTPLPPVRSSGANGPSPASGAALIPPFIGRGGEVSLNEGIRAAQLP